MMPKFENPPYYITAYGLAVKRGFKGTLDEWLASLQGKRGDKVELRYQDEKIQWRWIPDEDGEGAKEPDDGSEWLDLIDVSEFDKNNALDLFKKNITITMNGKFECVTQAYLPPTEDDAKDMLGKLVFPDKDWYADVKLVDLNGDGVVDEDDTELAINVAKGLVSMKDCAGAKKSDVTISIDMSNAEKTICISGVNMWGTVIETYIGADPNNSSFASKERLDKMFNFDIATDDEAKTLYRPHYTAEGNEYREYLNPPFMEDVSYLTYDRYKGSKVYKKLDSATGRLLWSVDEKTWYTYATLMGATAGGSGSDGGQVVDLSGYAKKNEIPTKTSQLTNDSGFITKAPVDSVNGKTGAVNLTASDVGARPVTWTPTAQQVGADPVGTAENKVSAHNTDNTSHNDLRLELKALADRLNGDSGSGNVADYVRTAAGAVAEKMLGITGEASAEAETAGGYTNLLPLAIDTDGRVFNGSGYITGYRLNSGGAAKEITESYYDAAVCATGFIPCQAGDIIHLQGMVIDPTDEQAGSYNIHVYDSSFATVGYSDWGHLPDNAATTTDNNGYISTITLEDSMGSADVAYIRLCAKNITADSIVTVNEAITSGGAAMVDASVIPFNLAFLTDLHWNDADKSRYRAAAQALHVIAETGSLDLVCFGGDYIHNWTEETTENARADISACRSNFADLPVPSVWLRGNHENNGYAGQRLTRQEIFLRTSRAQNTLPGYVSNPADPYGCYGYLDFDNARIRVIAVNTGDNDAMGTAATASGNTADLINCHNIAAAQLQWIADKALDLTDKEEPKKWTILVLSHIPIYSENSWYNSHSYTDGDGNTWSCNVVNLETLMAAYRDGGSFSVSLNGETASGDFSGTVAAGNIVFINGHGHSLNQITHNGFVYITCPNLCDNGEKASADGVVYAKGEAGTAEEISFNVLTVDPANRKVHAWIYGAGYDREITV